MAETKPRAEQIRFISDETGEHTIDTYIEQAERGGLTIGDLLDAIFDTSGNIKTDLFEFRIEDQGSNDYDLQFRVGPYVDPEEGWVTISEPVFNQILTAAVAEKNAAVSAASTATVQAGISSSSASTATAQAVIATDAANVASAASVGMNWKKVRAITKGALPSCTYSNGSSGVGATLTATANGAIPTQDGVTLVVGNRVGVILQASQLQNGVYTVTQVGSAGTPWILTRATDADSWSELVSQVILSEEGTTLKEVAYICTVDSGGTIGTTAVTFGVWNMPIADGSVSTSAKMADGIVTFVKLASAAISSSISDLTSGTASKLVKCADFKSWLDTVFTPNFYGARVYRSTAQSIPNAAWTAISFDAEDYDDNTWHDLVNNPTRITFNFTGRVLITAGYGVGTTTNASYGARILKNGSSAEVRDFRQFASGSAEVYGITLSTIINVTNGDYIELQVYQNTGVAVNCSTGANTHLSAQRIK